MSRIETLLTGKDAKQKARIKGEEIAKAARKGEFTKDDLRIDIQSITKIDGGVEVLARAWKNGKQLGFGKDGSVEIERFRFYIGGTGRNGHLTHIVVPDPNGDITVDYSEHDPVTGETREWTERYREDPEENLRIAVANTIRQVGKENGSIVKGKVGRTTSTFNPEADPATTAMDANYRLESNGATWATLRGADNDNFPLPSDSYSLLTAFIGRSTTGTNWRYLSRSVALFPTAALNGEIVASATLSVYGNNEFTAVTTSGLSLVSANPASNTESATADYAIANFGTTELATRMSHATYAVDQYNAFTLNASGLANINTAGGVSKFGFILGNDFDNSEPSGGSADTFGGFNMYSADEADSNKHPKLVVEHEAAGGGSTSDFFQLF